MHATKRLMSNAFCVIALWKYDAEIICLQQRFVVLVKQGWLFHLSKVYACISFLLLWSLLPPIKSRRFFVSFKDNKRGFLKISLTLGSFCKICQILLIMCLRSGRVLLKVTIKGNFFIVLRWVFIQNFIPGSSNSFVDVGHGFCLS